MPNPFLVHAIIDDGAGGKLARPIDSRLLATVATVATVDAKPEMVAFKPTVDTTNTTNTISAKPVDSSVMFKSYSVAAMHPDLLRFNDPEVYYVPIIRGVGAGSLGTPRGELDVPISPSMDVSLTTIFEGAKDPTQQFYVPTYQVAVLNQQYQILLDADPRVPANWQLTMQLTQDPPPPRPAGASAWTALPPKVIHAALLYTYNNNRAPLNPERLELNGTTLKVVFEIDNKFLHDQIYGALTDAQLAAALTITQTFQIAVPAPPSKVPIIDHPPPHPMPRVMLDAELAAPAFATPAPAAPTTPPVGPPLFFVLQRDLAQSISPTPFVFNEHTNAYMFPGIDGVTLGNASGLKRVPATWKGQAYNYYQDLARRDWFYFIPDAFKIARANQPPYYPAMSITVAGDSAENARVTLGYTARSLVDLERLEDAKQQLKPFATGEPILLPLPALNAKLRLALPGGDGASGPYESRDGAHVDLASGIQDSFTRPLPVFQQLFDSLFDDAGTYFKGDVTVHVEDADVVVPFLGRANDLVGSIFALEQALDGTKQKVTLRNAIEGTIHLPELARLSLALVHAGAPSTDPLVTTDPALPVVLKPAAGGQPGDALAISVQPKDGPATDGDQVTIDLRAARVTSDPETLWNAILDQRVAPHVERTVTVKVPAGAFGPADKPEHRLLSVGVQFETGESLDVDAPSVAPPGPFVAGDVKLAAPIADFILRKPADRSYRYKVTAVYLREQVTQPDWITDHKPSLILTDIPQPSTVSPH